MQIFAGNQTYVAVLASRLKVQIFNRILHVLEHCIRTLSYSLRREMKWTSFRATSHLDTAFPRIGSPAHPTAFSRRFGRSGWKTT